MSKAKNFLSASLENFWINYVIYLKFKYEGKQKIGLSNVVNESVYMHFGLKLSSSEFAQPGGKTKKINLIIKHSALIVLISAHILHINHLIRLTLLK